jgi:hypothetical protein
MEKFLCGMLSADGKISSKRFITFLAFLVMCAGFFTNLFFGKVVDPTMFDAFKWIVLGGLGFTASEQFSNKAGDKVSSQLNGAATKDTTPPVVVVADDDK